MRLTIEIAAATLLVVCISASHAAFAAGKTGRSADGLSCGFSVPQNATPVRRCAAIKREILRELLRHEDAVGDVRGSKGEAATAPTQSPWLSPGRRSLQDLTIIRTN
jgi:hypothetical protein